MVVMPSELRVVLGMQLGEGKKNWKKENRMREKKQG
jgi:hypothetical protein